MTTYADIEYAYTSATREAEAEFEDCRNLLLRVMKGFVAHTRWPKDKVHPGIGDAQDPLDMARRHEFDGNFDALKDRVVSSGKGAAYDLLLTIADAPPIRFDVTVIKATGSNADDLDLYHVQYMGKSTDLHTNDSHSFQNLYEWMAETLKNRAAEIGRSSN